MLQLPESVFIVKLLTHDLAPDLYYHTIDHTLDVYNSVQKIGLQEKCNATDLKLIPIAALYHDCGYIDGKHNHESRSCEIAVQVLPGFGYSQSDVDIICSLIMVTKLPQEPNSLMEQIICDADLDYLGRADFFTIGNRLYREMLAYGHINNEDEWYQLQIEFLKNHRYFTATANITRNAKKQEHLNILLAK